MKSLAYVCGLVFAISLVGFVVQFVRVNKEMFGSISAWDVVLGSCVVFCIIAGCCFVKACEKMTSQDIGSLFKLGYGIVAGIFWVLAFVFGCMLTVWR